MLLSPFCENTPTSPSRGNRHVIRTAVERRCLAGVPLAAARVTALADLDAYPGDHFVILLVRTSALNYRGIYWWDEEGGHLLRCSGTGPQVIVQTQVKCFFKFDSGSRSFNEIQTREFTNAMQAVTLKLTNRAPRKSVI
jgi:hypothetical protein